MMACSSRVHVCSSLFASSFFLFCVCGVCAEGMSKRVTLQQKYKIQKRVKEYKRKLKKAGKKLGPNGGVWKSKKEANIPNDWPFKQQMLSEIERQKELEREAADKNKQARKILADKKKRDAAAGIAPSKGSEETSVLPRGMGAPIAPSHAESNAILLDAATKRAWRDVKAVVEEADVVLEVLDARDPLGSRCLELEQWAHGKLLEKKQKGDSASAAQVSPKPIILVLNKTDLVPVSVTQAWLDFFAKHDSLFPVVAFHCNKALESNEAKGTVVSPKEVCAGAEALMQLIHTLHADAQQQQGNNGGGEQSATLKVGVIGYGNVGKSSVLNTLARTHLAGVGLVAGYTKSVARFRLAKGVYALDSPAVPAKSDAPGPHIELPLSNNRIKEDVEQFLRHFDLDNVQQVLQVPANAMESIDSFLAALAKRVRMMKGAELNHVLAARTLLKDWNAGKIPYFTAPPDMEDDEEEEGGKEEEEEEGEKSALQQFFVSSNRRVLLGLKAQTNPPPCPPESAFLVVEGSLFEEVPDDDEDGEGEEEDEEMEEDQDDEMDDDDDEEEEEEEEEEVPPPPPAKKGKQQQQQPQKKQPAPAAAAPAAAASSKKKGAAAAAAPVAAPAAPASRKRPAARAVEESEEEEEEAAPAPPAKKHAAASKANGNKPAAAPAPTPAPAPAKKAAAAAAKPAKQAPVAAAAAAVAPPAKKGKSNKK
jgi:nuclear GTP-binding protein